MKRRKGWVLEGYWSWSKIQIFRYKQQIKTTLLMQFIFPYIIINMIKTKLFTFPPMLKFSFQKCLSSFQRFTFLTSKPSQHHDLIFIRHAQSIFNQACEQYRKAHHIPYVWKQLCNHQGFDQTVLFNTQFMDAPLTQNGKNQCKKTQQILKQTPVDCVLVSPQLRALQTCQNIFQGRNLPVFVEPLLVGPLRSCCDVNKPTNIKKAMFPDFDFSNTQNYHELWYLDYLSKKQQKIYKEHFKKKEIENIDDIRVEIVQLLKQKKIYEDAKTFRRRVETIKAMIKDYKKRYETIAMVTHYYTIEYISALEYKSNGSPNFYIDIENCKPYYASVADLERKKPKTEFHKEAQF